MIDLKVWQLLYSISSSTFELVDYLNLSHDLREELNKATKEQYPKAILN